MSDVEKVPPGYKRCPGCKEIIAGPRTRVCGGCGHEFYPAATPKPAKQKNVKAKDKESPVIVPDPYTFTEAVDPVHPKEHWIEARANGITRMRKSAIKTLAYIDTIVEPEPVHYDNQVEMVIA